MKLIELHENKKNNGGYFSLSLQKTSSDKLKKLLKDIGVKEYIRDFHVTIMYDDSNPDIDVNIPNKTYLATIDDIELLGEPGTKWYAVVLSLKSNSIEKRHKNIRNNGFKHSYNKFKCHMSLKYAPTKQDIEAIKDNFDIFKELGILRFHNETREMID